MFATVYDIINHIEKRCPKIKQYDADTFSTAYRIPVHIWYRSIDIPIADIATINKNLNYGGIYIAGGHVILSYN